MVRTRTKIITLLISSLICLLIIYFFIELQLKSTSFHSAGTDTIFDKDLGWITTYEEKIENKKHIIIVGDSIVWGYGVNRNETVSYYLNKLYPDYQVLNLGVSGYGLDQEYLYLKKKINETNPEKIIIVIYPDNDITETSTNSWYGKSKPLFHVDSGNLYLTNIPLSRYSCANLYPDKLSNLGFDICRKEVLGEEEKDNLIRLLLKEFEKISIEYNSSLLFVLSPPKKSYEKGVSNNYKYMKKLVEDYNYIDFYEVVNNNTQVEDLYYDVAHYTPIGNDYLAKTIYRSLVWE